MKEGDQIKVKIARDDKGIRVKRFKFIGGIDAANMQYESHAEKKKPQLGRGTKSAKVGVAREDRGFLMGEQPERVRREMIERDDDESFASDMASEDDIVMV